MCNNRYYWTKSEKFDEVKSCKHILKLLITYEGVEIRC